MSMDNSQEILLTSLRNSGVSIPHGISAIRDLTPATLYSICSQSVSLINDQKLSFPTSLPEDSMADCFRICSDLASAFQYLGFIGDISFHKFLYPSEDDLYKLVRFLVGRLAESFEAQKAFDEKNILVEAVPQSEVLAQQSQMMGSANHNSGDALIGHLDESDSSISKLDCTDDGGQKSRACTDDLYQEGTVSLRIAQNSVGEVGDANRSLSGKEETYTLEVCEYVHQHDQELSSLQVNSSEDKLLVELTAKTSELQHLEDEFKLFSEAVEMAFDDEHSIDFYIQELSKLVESRRNNLVKQKSHWNTLKSPLEEKKRNLEEASWLENPNTHEKLHKKKAIEQEMEGISAEIKRREEEISALSAELENRTKVTPRWSFVQQVKEITKNRRKQDIDIERILKDTRDLQLESNSIQERLNRTYAVVSETVFREARKGTAGQQAYRTLTKIHEAFEQTAETILATDRIRREVAYYDAKLANMASQSLNIDKLQADLDVIRKENDILEQHLEKTLNT